ncbi:type II secretion system F family protein [Kitasatospora sp. NBC_00240]|uniref:type II secretion system F family protein n=1 Tax=Kitasatospora sp. NBC_00240 TaxID=2903567 RepID=UPI0022518AEC|nr:type II secretion system F family protein [Kitasatospora sp. NBC_00240]MCX5212046.1 type II secretion system F family protein [Kitasatospora sp. NBC_00240]
MTVSQVDMYSAAALCGAAVAARQALRRRVATGRYARLLPVGAVGGAAAAGAWPPPRAGMWLRARRALRRRLGAAPPARPPWLVPELLLLPVGSVAWQALQSPLPPVAAAAAVLPLHRWRRRRHLEAEARQRAAAVIELCVALSAELRSGATPEQALYTVTARIAADQVSLRRLGREPVARLAAGRYGGDVPAAFELLAELPGGRGAAAVAACWQVTAGSGSGFADGLEQVAESLRAEQALAEEIEGELAAPRTTIAVLAVLPVLGLLLGATLGARPLDILLHTPAGLACLAGGAALEVAGLAWTARIVRTARGGAAGPGPVRGKEGSGPLRGGDGDRGDGEARCGVSRLRPAAGTAGAGQGQVVLR